MVDPTLRQDETSMYPELPDWGVYLRWPTDGQSWICSADLSMALQLIPSRRIFRRTRWDRTYYQLEYGKHTIRVRPSMWLKVAPIDLTVGQKVELRSHFGLNDAGIYTIADILLARGSNEVEYHLNSCSMRLPKSFRRSDLKPLHVTYVFRPSDFANSTPKSTTPSSVDLLQVGQLTDE
jgi:hypothetical protein